MKFFLKLFILLSTYAAGEKVQECGTKTTDYSPCVSKRIADSMFRECCQQYAPSGCLDLCQYETNEQISRRLLLKASRFKACDVKYLGVVLYCASHNQNNKECCEHLDLANESLGVGDRCLRFCDPHSGIKNISSYDTTCLFNWNVLMYCHHSGIRVE